MANTKKKTTTAPKKEEVVEEVKAVKTEEKQKNVDLPPLKDTDEIEVTALIPNVSYKSNHTGDMYKWDDIGDIELMPFDEVKNMWRNYKGYFKNLWLRPLDERVFKQLRLGKIYEDYDFLMDENSYTPKNVNKIIETFSTVSSGVKLSTIILIKKLVADGTLSDIKTIRTLEKRLGIDLISLLD